MAKYKAPENYIYDMNSGQYFRALQIHDEQGKPVHHVIWFDTETGEYTQKSYYLTAKNKAAWRPVFFIMMLSVAGVLVFLYSNSFFTSGEILNQEEMIETIGITDDDSKSLSFQPYEAILNDTGVLTTPTNTEEEE